MSNVQEAEKPEINSPLASSPPPDVPPLTDPGKLGIPISDDSSEDELSQIRALEEDQGIFYHEEVVVSPKNESDDDIPLRRFQLSHPVAAAQQTSEVGEQTDDSVPRMERRRSVRFSGPYDTEEDGRNQHFRTPSPESLRYIQALENPMSVGGLEDDVASLENNLPGKGAPPNIPTGNPPAYTSEDENDKRPAKPSAPTPAPAPAPAPASAPAPIPHPKPSGSLNELFISKVTQPFQNMIRRVNRSEQNQKNDNDSDDDNDDDDDDDDDDDYTEDEIAVLTYIDNYKPQEMELRPVLRPFTIEYIAAMGDVDLFIKVPRPDDIDDNVGLTQIDEPPCNQSDATIVDMQIRNAVKDSAVLDDEVPVKLLERADQNPDEISKWITSIKELHKSKPAQSVHYRTQLPDIDTLMQEWAPKLESVMKTAKMPPADLDAPLEEYVDICLNLLDIPVGKSRIESLHLMFSLLNEFNNSQHFRNLAQNNNLGGETGESMDRLEL
uniref:Intraflagellar transport protein 46 homolog n=2 Tax=Caenorhabditis japonica TaxID=281687 RepID=A0A8R1HKL5_CAEJA